MLDFKIYILTLYDLHLKKMCVHIKFDKIKFYFKQNGNLDIKKLILSIKVYFMTSNNF